MTLAILRKVIFAHGLLPQAVFHLQRGHALAVFHPANAAGGRLPPFGRGMFEMDEVGVYFLSAALVQARDFLFQLKDAHRGKLHEQAA